MSAVLGSEGLGIEPGRGIRIAEGADFELGVQSLVLVGGDDEALNLQHLSGGAGRNGVGGRDDGLQFWLDRKSYHG